jgi:uncharacterized protein YggE
MKTRIALAMVLCSLVLAAACTFRVASAAPTPADPTQPHRRTISVTGTATLDLTPDCADVNMVLTTDGARPKQAVAELRHKQELLLKSLTAAGVDPTDIKLGGLSLGQTFDEKGRPKAFAASISVVATTHKFDLIGDIMEAASDAGTQSISTTFRVNDLPSYKKKVREMALKAAAEKAHETVAAVGATLGPVSDISENANDWRAGAMDNAYNIEVRGPAPAGTPAMQPLTMIVSVSYDLV